MSKVTEGFRIPLLGSVGPGSGNGRGESTRRQSGLEDLETRLDEGYKTMTWSESVGCWSLDGGDRSRSLRPEIVVPERRGRGSCMRGRVYIRVVDFYLRTRWEAVNRQR